MGCAGNLKEQENNINKESNECQPIKLSDGSSNSDNSSNNKKKSAKGKNSKQNIILYIYTLIYN